MKRDNLGCSVCKPGEEYYEAFTRQGELYFQYEYRHEDGELFTTVANTLMRCRVRKDYWVQCKNKGIKIGKV